MLKAYTVYIGTTAIVCLQGRIVNGETTVLRKAINSQVNINQVVLDLARVTTIDAHGLGVMLELRQDTQSKGTDLKLMNVTNLVSQVLAITRLNTVFEIISQEELTLDSQCQQASTMELASLCRNIATRRHGDLVSAEHLRI